MHPRQQDDQADIVYHEVAADIVKQMIESRVTFNKRFLQELLRSQQEFNEEMFINELRHQLLMVLESENFHAPLYKEEVYKHVYLTLIYLAKHWPFNEKGNNGYPLDYVSHQPIEQKNLLLTSTGYQFDLKHNKDWFGGQQQAANPYNGQPLSRRDQQHLFVFFPQPAPEIDWVGRLLTFVKYVLLLSAYAALFTFILSSIIGLIAGFYPLIAFTEMLRFTLAHTMAYGAVGGVIGIMPFVGDIYELFHHHRNERHCRNEYQNLPEKVNEMDKVRNAPRIPSVKRVIKNTPPVSVPQSGLNSILNQHPGLNQLYAAKPVNDVKQEQKNSDAIPVPKPQGDLSVEPEIQLQSIKDTLEKYIIDLSNNREIIASLRQISIEIECVSDAKCNVDKTVINISRLISKLKEIERTDAGIQEADKYKNHHACVEFLEKVKVDIPKLQKFHGEQIIPQKLLRTLKI